MILNDYFRYPKDAAWDIARQCGVTTATLRFPEDGSFDLTNEAHWQKIVDDFNAFGVKPVVLEPLPNELHDHIKAGDEKRDESIERFIRMMPIMAKFGIRTVCFNWMAHIGWLRTRNDIPERGGARVTGFDIQEFEPTEAAITEEQLWENYRYFLDAVLPHAERHGVKLALHPDDPPRKLGNVCRIMSSYANIRKAIYEIHPSPNLGVTMCQANYYIMGEDLFKVIPELAEKIFFIHFRNTVGNLDRFRETFHDNGVLDMAALIKLYRRCGADVPVRVDHVPTLVGESMQNQGYDALGRLFAIGYLKGLLEAAE